MSEFSKELPHEGEVVVAKIKRLSPHGAYVALDEYEGLDCFLHISEISPSLVRNIGHFVREGQRVALKVIRVDANRRLVDLSLRRVSDRERGECLSRWKLSQKARSILSVASQRLGLSPEDVGKVATALKDAYGDIYAGLRVASEKGASALVSAGVAPKIATTLAKLAMERVSIPKARVSAILKLESARPNGVEVIRGALLKARESAGPDAEVKVFLVGAPRYKVEVVAPEAKKAAGVLQKVCEVAISEVERNGGRGSWERA